MKCPQCSCMEDKVIETRMVKDGDSIRRRRVCQDCGFRFTTYEMILQTDFMVVKRDKRREEFKLEKLRQGVELACWKRQVTIDQIDALIKTIVARLEALNQREILSEKIGTIAMEELLKLDHIAYVRFASVYRRFEDVGQFLEEIRHLSGKG